MVSFTPVYPPRPYTPPSPPPYRPHAQPISFFSILSPAQYWVRSTNHLAPRYAISFHSPVTSSLLETKRVALISQINFWISILHVNVSNSHCVHHQESSTVHTAIGICHTSFADCLLSVHHQESSTVHTAMVYVILKFPKMGKITSVYTCTLQLNCKTCFR